jgi:WD40 repeat protein
VFSTDLSISKSDECFYLHEFIHDARRFILYNRSIIEKTPLQVYNSALVFSPKRSIIQIQFYHQAPDWMECLSGVQDDWGPSLQYLEGFSRWAKTVAFSPDGNLLASGSYDGTAKLWNTVTGSLLHTLTAHSIGVKVVTFSLDGKLLAIASDDKAVRLWDPKMSDSLRTLSHSSFVYIVAFSPNSNILASVSDKTVQLWNPKTGDSRRTLDHLSSVYAVAFSPNSKILASASDETVELWDPVTGNLLYTLKGHLTHPFSGLHVDWSPLKIVTFSPDGKLLASASANAQLPVLPDDKTVKLWNSKKGVSPHPLVGHSNSVHTISFSPDSKLLASGSHDRTVRLWVPAKGALLYTLTDHLSWVVAVIFSPDGKLLATSSDKTVRLSDPKTGASLDTLRHLNPVDTITFSPNSKLLATAPGEKTVGLWNPAIRTSLQTLQCHSDSVHTITFSPNGNLVASGSDDGTVRLWDPATGAFLHTLINHSHTVWDVAFSLDSKLLATASPEKTVRLWDPETGALRHNLEGHLFKSGSYSGIFSGWQVLRLRIRRRHSATLGSENRRFNSYSKRS